MMKKYVIRKNSLVDRVKNCVDSLPLPEAIEEAKEIIEDFIKACSEAEKLEKFLRDINDLLVDSDLQIAYSTDYIDYAATEEELKAVEGYRILTTFYSVIYDFTLERIFKALKFVD